MQRETIPFADCAYLLLVGVCIQLGALSCEGLGEAAESCLQLHTCLLSSLQTKEYATEDLCVILDLLVCR